MTDLSEFPNLSGCLFRLFHKLRAAEKDFCTSDAGDRRPVVSGLTALMEFMLDAFPTVADAEGLIVPLDHLRNAIIALDDGTVMPLLKKRVKRGRTKESKGYYKIVGLAAAFVSFLIEYGVDSGDGATRSENVRIQVAKVLREAGVRPARSGGEVTARTVKEWCERVAAASKDEPERLIYDEFVALGPSTKMDSAEHRKTLELLAFMLQSMAAGKLQ